MSKFDVKMNKGADKLLVQIEGTIDEDADFSQFNLSNQGPIELDLSKVKGINSCGIREWIKWVGTAGATPITYSNCPKVIVDQVNMVDGFLPTSGKVSSFFVPYYNDESGSEKNVLFRYGAEFSDSGLTPPAEVKDEDGNPMEMDVIEAKYFKFLSKK